MNALQDTQQDERAPRHYLLYNTLLLPLVPGVLLYSLWRRYGQGRSAASLRGQWGHVPDDVIQAMCGRKNERGEKGGKDEKAGPRIWMHAVSVGETMAARPVARALRAAMPDARLALSVTTDTGYETAQAALRAGEVDAVFYFPLDVPFAVKRVLRALRPAAFLTVETELWPNVLHLARRCGARTFLVNGRVSDNLLRTAPRLGWVWRWMMGNLDGLLMRSSFDAGRMGKLGAPASRLIISGDVKLDMVPQDNAGDQDGAQNPAERTRWRRVLGIAPDAPLWVAGSTHLGEEAMVLRAYARLRATMPSLRLLVAPRHIERAAEVVACVQAMGFASVRRTGLEESRQMNTEAQPSADAVLVLDTVGELAEMYAAADVAFVGGSLIERGGHNVLEPVLRGVPVIFGPHVANFREAAALAEATGAGRMVHNEEELCSAAQVWLVDETARHAVAGCAATALREHRGAARRVAEIVAGALERNTTGCAA